MSQARVLVVEDEAIIGMEIESCLRKIGYSVISIESSGDSAIAKLKEEVPDLILMDIRIKGNKDGIETAELIRKSYNIPIVFLTAYLDKERIDRAKITMPFGYILKPIQERDLKITLEMALYIFKIDAERIRAENKLKERDEILTTALAAIDEAIFIMNNNGDITEFNDEWAKISGFASKSDSINKLEEYPDAFDVYWHDGTLAPLHKWAATRALNGEAGKDEKYYIVRKDTRDIWIGHYSFKPILNESGQILGAVVTAKKVTELYPDDQILAGLKSKYI